MPVRRAAAREGPARTAADGPVPYTTFVIPLAPAFLQAKLAVGKVDDPLELEADRAADQVMREGAPAGGECAACSAEEPPRLRAKAVPSSASSGAAPASVERALGSSGRPLDAAALSFFEPRFGQDFGAVRIHDDDDAAASATEIGALAYTHGAHIAFAPNQYAPGTSAGRRLLAHELAHVVQQAGTAEAGGLVAPAIARKPGPICSPSGRAPGSSAFKGTAEHVAIETDFLLFVAPGSGMVEYTIPESSKKGNVGYADMVDTTKRLIYEIKPPGEAFNGLTEVQRYVTMANQYCPPFTWSAGTDYPPRVLSFKGSYLIVNQYDYLPGVVVYHEPASEGDPAFDPKKVPLPRTKRKPGEQPVTEPVKQPEEKAPTKQTPELQPTGQSIPAAAMDQILEFIAWTVETAQDIDKACQDFLDAHPELAELIYALSVVILVATIIEDIVTLGAGLADDPVTFAIAWKLWDLATVMMERRAAQQLLRHAIKG